MAVRELEVTETEKGICGGACLCFQVSLVEGVYLLLVVIWLNVVGMALVVWLLNAECGHF